MPECAFCSHSGTLTAEHITSKWLRELFPGPKAAWYKERRFNMPELDWKARVVCGPCNNTWMSEIEARVQPILTPLITESQGIIPLSQDDARSIALFAIVKAIVLDQTRRDGAPFFARECRHALRERGEIPNNVRMWIGGYSGHRTGGIFKTFYSKANLRLPYDLKLYICTFAIGYFLIQTVAFEQGGIAAFQCPPTFDQVAVPLWPVIRENFVWPNQFNISTREHFEGFARRWGTVKIEF